MKKKIASIVMATAIMATNVANAAINVVHFDQNKNLTSQILIYSAFASVRGLLPACVLL